jgi:hypothetical protein
MEVEKRKDPECNSEVCINVWQGEVAKVLPVQHHATAGGIVKASDLD